MTRLIAWWKAQHMRALKANAFAAAATYMAAKARYETALVVAAMPQEDGK